MPGEVYQKAVDQRMNILCNMEYPLLTVSHNVGIVDSNSYNVMTNPVNIKS